ncbi:MAG: glycine cleavage system aminomethyltransferase GcvT [Actinomycetota bacterium]|nr:glycine cleavage system aminomethyltransferase GcvT [Actinomycetota bacterium]
MSLRRSPLHESHAALGARFVEFSGWEMPLSYPSGTLAEHLACRSGAVVFDVSHLGTVHVEGPGTRDLLQRTLSNDLDRIAPGRAQYTHLLEESDGSVADDIIVWWTGEDAFDVMPNAANTGGVLAAVGGTDVTDRRVVLAIQGPTARAALGTISPEAASVERFATRPFTFAGAPCRAAGTGYTGEDGVECALPVEVARAMLDALVSVGVRPAGLGARDTLRLEAGLPLHGHELGPGITPLQAGLGWVVGWSKPEFRGREALLAERSAGVVRLLRGLLGETRRPLRAGARCAVDGAVSGEVTSGSFSPLLGRGIALAFLRPEVPDGADVAVEHPGATLAARVVRPPFHRLAEDGTARGRSSS